MESGRRDLPNVKPEEQKAFLIQDQINFMSNFNGANLNLKGKIELVNFGTTTSTIAPTTLLAALEAIFVDKNFRKELEKDSKLFKQASELYSQLIDVFIERRLQEVYLLYSVLSALLKGIIFLYISIIIIILQQK